MSEVAHIRWLGLVVLAIVWGSLAFIALATMLFRPWKPKVVLVVLGSLLGLFVAVAGSIWVGGLVFSALMG